MLLNWCEEITNIDPSINFRAIGGWVKTVTGLDKSVLNGFSLVGEFVKAGDYKTELSFADASWDPSYWGGAPYGAANVTGDGSYQVYAYLPGLCEGAVVWTIELYGLWQDLVDPSKVEVTVNSITIPGKQ